MAGYLPGLSGRSTSAFRSAPSRIGTSTSFSIIMGMNADQEPGYAQRYPTTRMSPVSAEASRTLCRRSPKFWRRRRTLMRAAWTEALFGGFGLHARSDVLPRLDLARQPGMGIIERLVGHGVEALLLERIDHRLRF